ncbi:hypothetical protein BC835DRAFT_1422664 [Cytidiella melzeri]|nr:hypothetical protein BC835DRAFT_1422664 [Cytidiella melzeri]
MEHENTVEDYLAEIDSETLQQFLTHVRLGKGSSRWTGTSLDACLGLDDPARPRALQPGDVIEVQGAPASGKTHLVYQTVISCTLPVHSGPACRKGWGKSAVVFDSDGTFDVSRLKTLLATQISSTPYGEGEPVNKDELVASCLSRLHVVRPTSSIQLAATILNLANSHATESQFLDQEVGLVAIDSLSSFYWQDRFTTEQFLAGPSGHNAKNPLQHVITALESFRTSHRPVILLTNWGLHPVTKPSPDTGKPTSPFFKQHLHPLSRPPLVAPWNESSTLASDDRNVVTQPHQTLASNTGNRPNVDPIAQNNIPVRLTLTHHITLSSPLLPQFPADISIEEVIERDVDRRSSSLVGKVEGFLRTPGSSTISTFAFWICEDRIRHDSVD